MPMLADNNIFLKIGGVTVSAFFISVSMPNRTVTEIDVTAGSGVDHMQRAPGLLDTEMAITLTYDTAAIQTYITRLTAGQLITVEYGPEGAVSGKPKHVQTFLITSTDISEQTVAKDEITISIQLMGSGAPSVDMHAGGVYS